MATRGIPILKYIKTYIFYTQVFTASNFFLIVVVVAVSFIFAPSKYIEHSNAGIQLCYKRMQKREATKQLTLYSVTQNMPAIMKHTINEGNSRNECHNILALSKPHIAKVGLYSALT